MLPHPSTWNSPSRPPAELSATPPSAFLAHVGISPMRKYGIIINQGLPSHGKQLFPINNFALCKPPYHFHVTKLSLVPEENKRGLALT